MLPITIPEGEYWDEATETMSYTKKTVLRLEHSLISISKWEAKWCIPFFDSEKTNEQILSYIECMTLNPEVDPKVYSRLTADNIKAINDYIAAPMTASKVKKVQNTSKRGEYVSSELIYFWMIDCGVPVEFEKWHINRLIMLIRICYDKNKGGGKMSTKEIMRENRALNAARRAKYHTRG